MDIAALIALLIRNREFSLLASMLLAQWGPQGRRLIGADFMPPRLMEENSGVIERVSYYTVAAPDTTRYSPAPLVETGQMFGSIRYNLGDAKLARQFTGPDYDALSRYLGRRDTMGATALLIGWSDTALLQALVERDEFKIWRVLTTGGYGRFGDNGFVELVDGPDLSGQYIEAAEDWSDPTVNPWPSIEARIQRLVNLGYDKAGIRTVFTEQVRTILKSNPHTALRVGKSRLVTNSDGTIVAEAISGIVTDADIDEAFRALGVQAPISYDQRGFTPAHQQKRFFPEGNMIHMASTGRNENIQYNQDDPSQVHVVTNTLGFLGIGTANGESSPGRRVMVEPHRGSAARIEGEAWEAADPILLEPQAVCGTSGIQ